MLAGGDSIIPDDFGGWLGGFSKTKWYNYQFLS